MARVNWDFSQFYSCSTTLAVNGFKCKTGEKETNSESCNAFEKIAMGQNSTELDSRTLVKCYFFPTKADSALLAMLHNLFVGCLLRVCALNAYKELRNIHHLSWSGGVSAQKAMVELNL